MAETEKSNSGEISNEEVRKILEEAASKPPPAKSGTPLLSENALKAVIENVQEKGEVWKKPKGKKKSK